MTKALYPLILLAPIVAACIPIDDAPTCGPVPAVVISYTKAGFPIYDDQTAILPPCGGPTLAPKGDNPKPPAADSEPPIVPEPPVVPKPKKPKCNDGRGNGSEGSPDCDAGKSGGVNHGGD